MTWDQSGAVRNIATQWPYGIFWNEQTQLLYWTWYDSYNTGYIPDWNVGATRLDDASTGHSTAFGPWRTRSTDADGKTWYGMWRCMYLFSNPTDNSMMCGASLTSGIPALPWGPDAYGRATWPLASTPAGFNAPDLNLANRYLEYYFMGDQNAPNHVTLDGSLVGTMRAFRRRQDQALFEYFPTNYTPIRANPATNGGVGSWSDMDFASGAAWLELNNKKGVVYSATLNGSPVQDPSDCTNAAHEWYRNAGVGHDKCSHGCSSPVEITGPVTTHSFPALIIYDPADLMAVKAGTKTDYTVEPNAVINLETAYSIVTAPQTELQAKSISGMYFDPIRKYLFVVARSADTSRAGPSFREPLIHVFAIRD